VVVCTTLQYDTVKSLVSLSYTLSTPVL
jgi:hypothetical protein